MICALVLLAGAAVSATLIAPAKTFATPTVVRESDGIIPPKKGPDGYWRINFDYLTDYEYRMPGVDSLSPVKPVSGRTDGIPANVRELEARSVRLEGYMLPLALEKDGTVKEFLIMRSVQTCCYGATPAPTEWVVAKPGPRSPKVKPSMDVPLVFSGKFHVGELYRDGLFAGIYELELDRVSSP